ncbi:hypothetical protein ACFQ6C_26495 [Streptomyces sp. NPDC056454]
MRIQEQLGNTPPIGPEPGPYPGDGGNPVPHPDQDPPTPSH